MPNRHPEPPREDDGGHSGAHEHTSSHEHTSDTDEQRYRPPFEFDVLADFHGGALSDDAAAHIGAHLEDDPAAARVLAALDRVTADLRSVGADLTVRTPIPPEIAARISRSLAREREREPETFTAPAENVVSLTSRRRIRRFVAGGGILAAAAAAVIAVVLIMPVGGHNDTPPAAQQAAPPTPTDTPIDMSAGLNAGQIMTLIGSTELGPLTEPAILAGCLTANGIDAQRPILGSKEVHIDGRDGVLLILAGPQPPKLTALVVGGDCADGNADTIATRDLG